TDNGTKWLLRTAASSVYDSLDATNSYINPQDEIGPTDQLLPAPKITFDPLSQQLVLAFTADLIFSSCIPFYSECGQFTTTDVYVANGSLAGGNWTSRLVTAWSGLANETLNGVQDSYFYNPAIASSANGTIYLSAQFVNGSACASVPSTSWFYADFGGPSSFCGEGLELAGSSSDNGSTFTAPQTVDPVGSWFEEMPPGMQASMVSNGSAVWIAWTQTTCPGWNGTAYVDCEYDDDYPPSYNSNTTVIVSRLFQGSGLTLTLQEVGLPASTNWSVSVEGNVRTGVSGSPLSVSGVPANTNLSWSPSIVNVGPGVRYYGTPSLPSPGNFTANATITWTFTRQYTLTIASVPNYPDGANADVWFENNPQCTVVTFSFDDFCDGGTQINYNMTPGPGTSWVNAGQRVHVQVNPLNLSQFVCGRYCYFYTDYLNLTFQSWTGTGAGSYNGTANSTYLTLSGPVNETANFAFNELCIWSAGGVIAATTYSSCVSAGLTVTFEENGLPAGDDWGVSVWSSGAGQTTPYSESTDQTALSVVDPALTSLAYFQAYTVPSGTPGEVWEATPSPQSPLLGPLYGSSILHYALKSVAASLFPSTVEAVGLPNGTAWSYTVDGVSMGVDGGSANVTLPGGNHTFAGSPVYFTNGTGYVVRAIHVEPYVINETWSNSTGPSTNYSFEGPASIEMVYAPVYQLTAQASTGGAVSDAGSHWYVAGGTVALNATADAGYTFVGWTGTGTFGVTSSSSSIDVTVGAPVSEYATFAPNATSVYVVTVSATGLTLGGTYSIVFNGTTYVGNGTFALPAYLGGDYTISVPIALDNASSLVRFLPISFASNLESGPGGTFDLDSNGATINLGFATQYALQVSVSSGGSVDPTAGLYWQSSGNDTTLTATPSPGYVFAGWSGTGAGSVSAPTAVLAVTSVAPIAEAAQFLPFVPLPPATYLLTVTETGLPAGTSWAFTTAGTGAGTINGTASIGGLNGTYIVNVPTIRIGAGSLYLSNVTNQSEAVTSDVHLEVAFSAEFCLSVVAGSGGVATPGSSWIAAGATVDLQATPSTGDHFVGWSGSGLGNYTGADPSGTVTVSEAITEMAEFSPNTSTGSNPTGSGGSSIPSYAPWALLGGLLIVGIAVGAIAGRRPASEPPPEPFAEPEAISDSSSTADGAATDGSSVEYDESA
ncbi:MAG: hypothetical protein L3K03_06530, partial [Thermoplasmata archaeon]|nr:hypothetical protein [Thermoplasmata archaeon]